MKKNLIHSVTDGKRQRQPERDLRFRSSSKSFLVRGQRILGGLLLVFFADPGWAAEISVQRVAASLQRLDTAVLTDRREDPVAMLADDLRRRIADCNRRSSDEWYSIASRKEWETYCQERLARLEKSLGCFPSLSGPPRIEITRTLEGEGFAIENILFESRPELWVTANLYRPNPPRNSMPGIIICHSHHNPKVQGELQDMGMTWARLGCLVLVMDQLGHGERRDHPFDSAADYDGDFQVGRQDYYFRYNLGIQLHLIGESLIGWMVWDLRRGVDLLLSREGIDPQRIILLGSVAGGGDPAAVTAALDPRISAVVPFHFGGPQGFHPYPLPDDAEESFNYAGSGSWESTRNLRLSARDGYLPWVIVGSIAPRRLIYAHEFSWDRERDPVWKRLQKIFGEFYEVRDRLDYTHGFGTVRKRPPEASHCNNIGPVQRRRIHQILERWFSISGSPDVEYSERLEGEALLCLDPGWKERLRRLKTYQIVEKLGMDRCRRSREQLEGMTPQQRSEWLRTRWRVLLGRIEPLGVPKVLEEMGTEISGGVRLQQMVLEVEKGILVPIVILSSQTPAQPRPVVLCVAQSGKERFLRERSAEIAELVTRGAAVCIPDLRGTGETSCGEERGRTGCFTEISSSELMLGQTLLGSRLRDLRGVLEYLRSRKDVDATKVALWGDSFAEVNGREVQIRVPYDAVEQPSISEPLGGLLALLTALYEKDVKSVYARGGLSSFGSVLSSAFCYLPHDVVVPGAVASGDLPAIAAALSPRPVKLEGCVDGLNRKVDEDDGTRIYASVFSAYEDVPQNFRFRSGASHPKDTAEWLLVGLR